METKSIDLLDEDRPISGQKFVCISFISPEDQIKNKNLFFFEKFISQFDKMKNLEFFSKFISFISFKYSIDGEELSNEYKSFVETQIENMTSTISDDYKFFMDKKEDELLEVYNKENNFQTSVRGLKIRGSFSSQEEAENHCKSIREIDPNHDVYVGPVGIWIPFHPEAYKTGKVEYLEKELNELMHEKIKNEVQAKNEFDKRIHDSKKAAIEDNIKKATESNNTLTQNINKDGELVNTRNTEENNFEELKKSIF